MSSPVAESVVDVLMAIPSARRKPILQSILKSAGPEIEDFFLERKDTLVSRGLSAKDAYAEALSATIQHPEGQKILRVIAVAAARQAEKQGSATMPYDQERARLEEILRQAEDRKDEGLGFVATIVAAAAAVVSAAASYISSAVTNMNERRRRKKARLTPLTSEEIQEIAEIVAPKYPNYAEAEGEVLELINARFEGLRGPAYVMDPVKNSHCEEQGKRPGQVVNEYKDLVRAFEREKRRIEEAVEERAEQEAALEEQAHQEAEAEAKRRRWIYAGAATLGTAAVVTAVALV